MTMPGLPRPPAWQIPSGRDVDLWWLDVREAAPAPADLRCLDTAEAARARAFVFAADRDLYQAAHVLLRRVLAGYCGATAAGVRLRREACPRCGKDSGRPAIGALPGPAAGAGGRPAFSLAHAGTAVVIAVAACAVGVDVEQEPPGCPCPLLDAAHPGDRARLAAIAEPGRHPAVIRWWARLEAVVKCTGEGIAHGIGGFPVLAGPAAAAGPGVAGDWPAVTAHGCSLLPLPAPSGYHAALALAGTGGIAHVRARPAAAVMTG